MNRVIRGSVWRFGLPLLLLAGPWAVCVARDYHEVFEGERPSWEITCDPATARVAGHTRSRAIRHEGESAELVELEALVPRAQIELTLPLPPSRLLDELALTLWFHSNQDGVNLSARVVLPRQIDPRTGKVMTVLLEGGGYRKPGQWKQLSWKNPVVRLRGMLPQLRRVLLTETGTRHDIDETGAYVDAAILTVRMDRGRSRFVIDDLQLGPLVDASAEQELQQVAAETSRAKPDIQIERDPLRVQGQPFFPRIVPHHGERSGELSRMRFNVVWVPDYQDRNLLADLKQSGLWGMAMPPRPAAHDGATLDPERVQMAPFAEETAPILFWYLGTRIPPEAKRDVDQWDEQIRNADRTLNRPVTGDVSGMERAFSRKLSMLGVSRPALHTSFGLKTYRDWLIERRMQAMPGSLVWTWVQTDAVASVNPQRRAAGLAPIVVEPEQLRLQTYAAWAAGCRGIGYWTQSSLDADDPGAVERKLMLAQLNMECELLEPCLVTGNPASQTPFTAKLPAARKINQLAVPSGNDARSQKQRAALGNDRKTQIATREKLSRDLEAAILHTDDGILVLPVWYAENAQFVPGQMVANDARIVVPGVGDAARAWEITTTDIILLDSPRVAGGKQITLKKFDLTTAVLFTDDESIVERMREKMKSLRETSARVCLEMARAKYNRVIEVDRRLHERGKGQPDAADLLRTAKSLLDHSDADWQRQEFHKSRQKSADCMQILRILQHACWMEATSRIYSPVSSPHTLCYQTLPDHWDMVASHGRARHAGGSNLLRSGDFEDIDTMVAEGWKHEQVEIEGVRAAAELYPKAKQGAYCLRLIATPATGQDPPTVIGDRPVTVTTPPVTIYKGQIVHISGWVKVAAPSLNNLEGALLYDSLGGSSAALRWRTKADWQKFDLVREAPETGELTITMALAGLGEICFDDLQIIPLESEPGQPSPGDKPAATPASNRGGAFDFLKKIPRIGGKAEPE